MADRRAYQRQKMAEKRAEARDMEYPAPADMRRRRRLEKDLAKWLKWYAPEAFPLPWAPFHRKAIRKIQKGLEQGGSFAVALPRGSGKTTLLRYAAIYGQVRGLIRYGLLVGATGKRSTALIAKIKQTYRFNQRLRADYPEICEPIRALEGVGRRADSQTAFGEPTGITYVADRLRLPTTRRRTAKGWAKNPAAGALLECCGITGDVRGAQEEDEHGVVQRPDFALVDDPQTKESANSDTQSKFRLGVILEDIAGSAGPGRSISVMVACTVIAKGDLADQILDRDAHPDFRGERHPLLESMPEDMDAWAQYNQERVQGLEDEDEGKRAAAYYRAHRAELDRGAVASWPDRYDAGEESAVQHALNLFYKWGEGTFLAEYQNTPVDEQAAMVEITERMVRECLHGRPRGVVPEDAMVLTLMADVNHVGINWCVAAYDPAGGMAGYVVDYGKYPEGNRWLYRAGRGKQSEEQAVFAGVVAVADLVLGRAYMRECPEEGGTQEPVPLDGLMFDANWQTATVEKAVKAVNRKHKVRARLSRARGSSKYRLPRDGKKVLRQREEVHEQKTARGYEVVYNADYWQMKAQQGFALDVGAPESTSLYGERAVQHTRFASEICAQRLYQFVRGEVYDAYGWTVPNGANDLLDALKGTRALATLLAPSVDGRDTKRKRRRKRRRVSHQAI